jgi:hypothetical protein
MSSFKRRTTAKQAEILTPGTRISQATPQTIVTSTGIPSLDDILGGGLPLSCLQTILAPDAHSAYGELVQKYFVAQGLASGHRVVVIDTDPRLFVEECLWLAKGAAPSSLGEAVPATGSLPSGPEGSITTTGDEDEDGAHATAHADDAKIKIAWRYEQMKRFQTTVAAADTVRCFCTRVGGFGFVDWRGLALNRIPMNTVVHSILPRACPLPSSMKLSPLKGFCLMSHQTKFPHYRRQQSSQDLRHNCSK